MNKFGGGPRGPSGFWAFALPNPAARRKGWAYLKI
jgi:hypothetical protein